MNIKLYDKVLKIASYSEGLDFDTEKELHICCGSWLSNRELEDYEKVENV